MNHLHMARFLATGDPAACARATGRSWWVMRYLDGRIVREWECDWPQAPRKGRQALRLYTPDGKYAEVGGATDCTGLLFQFKLAFADVPLAGGVGGRSTAAHVIGLIDGTDGQCACYRWDYRQRRLIAWRDNAWAMAWEQLGPLATDHLGLASA